MCHIFPGVMEKPAFPTKDAPIDKRNLFLLSGTWLPVVDIRLWKKSRFQLIEKVISKF